MPSTPEQAAREQIDSALLAAGWVIQDYKAVDLGAARGIALREVPLTSGRCDYLLLVDRKTVGVIEAKKVGVTLSTVAEQSAHYGQSLPDFLQVTGKLPYYYESTGVETFFRDERDLEPRSRRVFSFHRPETLAEWLTEPTTLRFRLAKMPFAHPLSTTGMRECQIEAITSLEKSFTEAKPRALIQMATGAGIVACIEKQFTRLEAGVAALKRVRANLKRYRASVLKAACEGRLVPTEAELARAEDRSYEPADKLLARILTERRQKWSGRGNYKESPATDTKTLHQIPQGWTWANPEQLSSLVTSGSRGWGNFYSDSGPLFIRAQDIKTDSLKLSGVARVAIPEKAEGTRSSVQNDDLLITITGANVTKSAFVRGLVETAFVSQHVALLKPTCRDISPYLYYWIVSPANGRKNLEKWAYGAGKPGLSLDHVRNLPVALPPLAEQKRIVAEVERRLSVADQLEAVVITNLQRATRLRQSILQKAFTCGA